MPRNVRSYSSNNFYVLIVIFDILSKIAIVLASIVLIYWLLAPVLVSMGIVIPAFIKNFCHGFYGLANMVGYVHRSGFNWAGGIAALILYIIGYIFEFVCNIFITRY